MPTINRKARQPKQIKYNHNKEAAKYYNSKLWNNLRNRYIREHPLCENCNHYNIVKPAEHVHHIRPFMRGLTDQERWQLLLDEDNLKSLCIACHHEEHKRLNHMNKNN